MTKRILVPIDFSPCSDAALEYALALAEESDAEVEVLYVWCLREPARHRSTIFADTPQGVAMQERLTAAESLHAAARICGRLEFGEEPSIVILSILHRERFDMVVMGEAGERCACEPAAPSRPSGHVTASVVKTAPCKVVTTPPPPSSAKIVAA